MENGWPKSKSNTGNGFLGVDYIYLDTSYVPIKVYLPGGEGGGSPLRGGVKFFFKSKNILKNMPADPKGNIETLKLWPCPPPPIPVRTK